MATVTISVNNTNSFCCSYSTKFRAKFNIYSVNFCSSLVGSVLLSPVGVSLSSIVPNLSSGFYESTWPHKNDKISGWQSLLSKASLSWTFFLVEGEKKMHPSYSICSVMQILPCHYWKASLSQSLTDWMPFAAVHSIAELAACGCREIELEASWACFR